MWYGDDLDMSASADVLPKSALPLTAYGFGQQCSAHDTVIAHQRQQFEVQVGSGPGALQQLQDSCARKHLSHSYTKTTCPLTADLADVI